MADQSQDPIIQIRPSPFQAAIVHALLSAAGTPVVAPGLLMFVSRMPVDMAMDHRLWTLAWSATVSCTFSGCFIWVFYLLIFWKRWDVREDGIRVREGLREDKVTLVPWEQIQRIGTGWTQTTLIIDRSTRKEIEFLDRDQKRRLLAAVKEHKPDVWQKYRCAKLRT